MARTGRSALPCVIFPSGFTMPNPNGLAALLNDIGTEELSSSGNGIALLYISLPADLSMEEIEKLPDLDHIISITQWESGHRQQVAYHLMHVEFQSQMVMPITDLFEDLAAEGAIV